MKQRAAIRFACAVALLGASLVIELRTPRHVEAAVDLTGDWNLVVDDWGIPQFGPHLCAVSITQIGSSLSIDGTCDMLTGVTGTVTVSGTIDTGAGSFSATGTGGNCPFEEIGATISQTISGGTTLPAATTISGTFECEGGLTQPFSTAFAGSRLDLCGNGVLDPGEQCDDANTADGDGCSAGCREERPDAFTCYRSKTTKGAPRFEPRELPLTDQFESKITKILRPRGFCNPTSVMWQRVFDPTAHLTCYRIKDQRGQPRFTPREIVVQRPGRRTDDVLTVRRPQALCVPSTRDGIPSDLGIDHFKCYRARSASHIANVVNGDGWSGLGSIRRVSAFCNPVDKNGEGIIDPTNHLLCARLSGRDPVKRDVVVDNQFGEQMLTAIKAKEICFPVGKCDPLPAACTDACGNGTVEAGCCERCDPPFASGGEPGCADTCQSACGNNVVDAALGEECDPPDDAACHGLCGTDCTCPPASPSGAFVAVTSGMLD